MNFCVGGKSRRQLFSPHDLNTAYLTQYVPVNRDTFTAANPHLYSLTVGTGRGLPRRVQLQRCLSKDDAVVHVHQCPLSR